MDLNLRFPKILTNHELYFIQFEAYELEKVDLSSTENLGEAAETVLRNIQTGDVFDYSTRVNELNDVIMLPLQTTPKEETSASFTEESTKKTSRLVSAVSGDRSITEAISATMMESAANKFGSEVKNTISNLAGKAINEQMQVFYEGPQRRSYAFEFTLIAKSLDEAKLIKQIVTRFHYYASPGLAGSKLFFDYPNLLLFKFFRRQGESYSTMKNLFQSKFCYLENVNVEYGDEVFSEFIANNKQLGTGITKLSLTLKEIEYHTKEDFKDTEDLDAESRARQGGV